MRLFHPGSESRPKIKININVKGSGQECPFYIDGGDAEGQQQVPHRAFGPIRNDKLAVCLKAYPDTNLPESEAGGRGARFHMASLPRADIVFHRGGMFSCHMVPKGEGFSL